MNTLELITPKSELAYLYDDYSVRQALEKMRFHGYAAIPVITRDGRYVATVSEGDFLWHLLDEKGEFGSVDTEKMQLKNILTTKKYPAVNVNADFDVLFAASLEQNYVPLVDDRQKLIGIITRRALLAVQKKNADCA